MPAVLSFWETLEPLPDAPPPRRESFTVEASPAQTEQILFDAQARASERLSAAEQEAEALLEDARVQSEALREAAWQEGFHAGQTAGQAAIEITLRDEWETEKQDIRARLAEMMEAIGDARQSLWERQEAEMTTLVLTIARQVVKTEVTQNTEIIRAVIQNAMRRVTDKEHVRLRVSAADAPGVKAMREEILSITDGLREIEIIDDRRIGEGGCVIETNAGSIDARIETQFAEVERAIATYTGAAPETTDAAGREVHAH